AIYEIRVPIYGNYLEGSGADASGGGAGAGGRANEGLRDGREDGQLSAIAGWRFSDFDSGTFLDQPRRVEQWRLRSRAEMRRRDSADGAGRIEAPSSRCRAGLAGGARGRDRSDRTGHGREGTSRRSRRLPPAGIQDVAHDFDGAADPEKHQPVVDGGQA